MDRRFLNYYIKFAVYVLSICGCTIFSNAQGVITTSDILRSSMLESGELPYSDNISFLSKGVKGLPIVESLNFRTETDEFSFDQQEYTLRFKMNSINERKAYDEVLASNREVYALKQEEYIIQKTHDIYKGLVDYYFESEKLELTKRSLQILYDRKRVFSKLLANSDKVNVNNWFSNQNDIIDERNDSLDLELSRDLIQKRFFENDGMLQSISFDDLITIDKIQQTMKTHLTDFNSNTALKLAAAEERNAKAEYELESAEVNKMIDFFQVKYQADRDVSFQKELSFGSSINIPSGGSNRAKKNKAALEAWDKSYEKTIEQEKVNAEFYSNILNLDSAIKKYRALEISIESQQLEKTLEEYNKLSSISPLTLLKVKENIIRFQKKLLEEKENVYQAYLDLLAESSLYSQFPAVNYLSDNLSIIE